MNRASMINAALLTASLAASGCASEASVNNAFPEAEAEMPDAGASSTDEAPGDTSTDTTPGEIPSSDEGTPAGTTPTDATTTDATTTDATTTDATTTDATPTDNTPGTMTPQVEDSTPATSEACPKGRTSGSTVLLIGDSYLDFNGKAYGDELQRLAREGGSLGANESYEDRSVSGSQFVGNGLTDFLLKPIPRQYEEANNGDGHIKTVIMDGGGNDVLVGNRSCIDTQAPPANQSCVETIETALAAGAELLDQMERDGVENVVYFFYPHLPGGGSGGDKQLSNDTIDYAYPLARAMCENATLNCVFLDTRGLFPDAPGEFQDGIHPIVSNTQKISKFTWEAMQSNCIAQ